MGHSSQDIFDACKCKNEDNFSDEDRDNMLRKSAHTQNNSCFERKNCYVPNTLTLTWYLYLFTYSSKHIFAALLLRFSLSGAFRFSLRCSVRFFRIISLCRTKRPPTEIRKHFVELGAEFLIIWKSRRMVSSNFCFSFSSLNHRVDWAFSVPAIKRRLQICINICCV